MAAAADQRVPEEILAGIAARPDDVGAWEVLSDYLMENELPGATLARCELELMRGISNPELLSDLADARWKRPRLPHEPPYGSFEFSWRCGFVVKAPITLDFALEHLADILGAPAMRGLHHLSFDDRVRGQRHASLADDWREQYVERLLGAVTPHVRRVSIVLGSAGQVAGARVLRVLELLSAKLPASVERVDLSSGPLQADGFRALMAVARRVKQLNLDGTALHALGESAMAWVQTLLEQAPECTVFLGGTGLSMRTPPPERAEWLVPEAVGWLEHEPTGSVVPLMPLHAHDGFVARAWPDIRKHLERELLGWFTRDPRSPFRRALQDGDLLSPPLDGWRLHLR